MCIVPSQVAFAWFGQHATLAVAIVGLVMGLVGPVLGSPVKRKIKLMTSSAMVARSRPKELLSTLVLLCGCCCVVVDLLLIVVFLSIGILMIELFLIVVLFSIGNLMIVASLSVSVTIVGGSMMGAVLCW